MPKLKPHQYSCETIQLKKSNSEEQWCRRGAVGPASMQFYRALAEKKLSRFKQFAAIYPECCWVFMGDNGQASLALFSQDS